MTGALLLPLRLLYGAAVRSKNRRYDKGASRSLAWPVVSVGNLSVGGSGKTPLVIRLGQLLAQEGWEVDVLSRGYGRSGSDPERVDTSVESSLAAERFGDEPLMIAKAARLPVYVADSRYRAGELAERQGRTAALHVHLLDDGFQHRQLARAVDIVTVHRADLTDRLLPSGRLREPLASLRRADAIVLRDSDSDLAARLKPYAKKGTPFWYVRRRLSPPEERRRALAFCAIARPDEFFQGLEAGGTGLVARMRFRDHHKYISKDIDEIGKVGRLHSCEEFVTTDKDAVKLSPELRSKLIQIAPLRVASLSLEIEDEGAVVAQLIAMIEASQKRI